jgi:hypothetical protein
MSTNEQQFRDACVAAAQAFLATIASAAKARPSYPRPRLRPGDLVRVTNRSQSPDLVGMEGGHYRVCSITDDGQWAVLDEPGRGVCVKASEVEPAQ